MNQGSRGGRMTIAIDKAAQSVERLEAFKASFLSSKGERILGYLRRQNSENVFGGLKLCHSAFHLASRASQGEQIGIHEVDTLYDKIDKICFDQMLVLERDAPSTREMLLSHCAKRTVWAVGKLLKAQYDAAADASHAIDDAAQVITGVKDAIRAYLLACEQIGTAEFSRAVYVVIKFTSLEGHGDTVARLGSKVQRATIERWDGIDRKAEEVEEVRRFVEDYLGEVDTVLDKPSAKYDSSIDVVEDDEQIESSEPRRDVKVAATIPVPDSLPSSSVDDPLLQVDEQPLVDSKVAAVSSKQNRRIHGEFSFPVFSPVSMFAAIIGGCVATISFENTAAYFAAGMGIGAVALATLGALLGYFAAPTKNEPADNRNLVEHLPPSFLTSR